MLKKGVQPRMFDRFFGLPCLVISCIAGGVLVVFHLVYYGSLLLLLLLWWWRFSCFFFLCFTGDFLFFLLSVLCVFSFVFKCFFAC